MVARERASFFDGINGYVPAMSYASHLSLGEPTAYSLGTPAAVSANSLVAAHVSNAVAATVTTLATVYTADSPYGRTLRMTPSADPGNAYSIDAYGFDYLRQPMRERFTGANGSTGIIYGQKAFYKVTKFVVVIPATNGITTAIGTGWRLGLPYKGDVNAAKEAGVLIPVATRPIWLYADRSAADAVAGGSKWIRAPFAGYVKTLSGTPDGGGSTNDPVITVKRSTVAIVGLTVTIDTSDTTGLTVTDTPTTVGYNANNRFRKDDLIEIVGAAAASAKGDRVGLELDPTQYTRADITDPATALTADTRGTYEPNMTPDGASEIVVWLLGDNSVNAAGNGGLHGIRHFP